MSRSPKHPPRTRLRALLARAGFRVWAGALALLALVAVAVVAVVSGRAVDVPAAAVLAVTLVLVAIAEWLSSSSSP